MSQFWPGYRELSGRLGPWASLGGKATATLRGTRPVGALSSRNLAGRCGRHRASIAGPSPRTRLRRSAADSNGRLARCSMSRRAIFGPTCGKTRRTLAGAVFGSTTRTGISRQNRRSAQPSHQLPIRRTSAETNTRSKSTIRARSGNGQELRRPGAPPKPARSAVGRP
jgi:hypothetical protein